MLRDLWYHHADCLRLVRESIIGNRGENVAQEIPTVKQTVPTPHQVSEAVLGWLDAPQPNELADQTASWGTEQWNAAQWAIQVHGMAPLLYQRLRRSQALDRLALPLRTYLADQYRFNGLRVAAMMAELALVLRAADEAGIKVVPLKGSVLVSHYYDDPALRPMSDLDLLVRPEDEAKMARLLLDLGCQVVQNTPRHQSFVLMGSGQQVVYAQGEHPDNPRHLDLHTEIQEQIWGVSYRMTHDVWAHCRPVFFGGAPGRLLRPLELLQHLLIHSTGDVMVGRVRLVQLYDIAVVGARLSPADWDLLVEEGQRRREERLLYAPLRLAERYLGRVAPPGVMADLAQSTPTRLCGFLERADLYYLSFCNPRPLSLGDKLSLYRPGREKLVAWRYRLVPTPKEMPRLYPRLARPHQVPMAYLVHFLRILVWPLRQMLRLPRLSWINRARGGRW